MAHVFQIPDETYQALSTVAASQGQTPEALLEAWIAALITQSTDARTPQRARTSEGMGGVYDPAKDPLASFLGAFEADAPDVVRKHDEYLGETYADTHRDE